ncbi:7-cyano-7-deazaguanine synthase QueC [Rickettsia endosymbiont of Halotydeus destructor]|uniref:7-cyano-7-deazaguanine synthase QueC n=1 Tax=Rickettsia endosymbiont of Halotydeus destructor TaxID=2996754 RepID=UPI003BB147C6
MKKAVNLVSGGADSSTVLAMVKKMNYEIHAISFNYHQRNKVELQKIKELIKKYDVKQHKIIDIDLRAFGGSALTDDQIDVPHYHDSNELADDIPVTYVPARNTIFLSFALGFAEIIGARDIFIGVHATDYANYPDCRPEYIKSFETMANLATAAGVQGQRIQIHAPLLHMTKAEIIKTGIELGVDYSKTISCYDPTLEALSCGTCHACLTRLDAFKKNKVQDPIKYI